MRRSPPKGEVIVDLKLYSTVQDFSELSRETDTAPIRTTLVPYNPLWSLTIRCPGQVFCVPSGLRSRSMRTLFRPMLMFLGS